MDTAAALGDWLSSPGCRKTLFAAAQFIYRQAVRLRLPHDLLPCRDPWGLSLDERSDCFEMLADELWICLRSKPPEWASKSQWALVAARGPRFLVLKIAQDFLHDLRDKARIYSHDPLRALYRRLRQVLYDEEGLFSHATGQGSFYSLDPEAAPEGAVPSSDSTPYSQWESPLGQVASKDLMKRSSLVLIARLFWEEANRRWGRPVFIPVRELVKYISSHYVLPSATATVSLDEANDDFDAMSGENPASLLEECSGEASFVGQNLETLAEQLAASWSDKQRAVFSLVQGSDCTVAEAARQLGYKSAAGADYQYKSALNVLRDFCLLWPGLSPPGLDSRLFEEFVLHLVKICKRKV